MIVNKITKTFETNSLFPNLDWYNEGNHVIDETTENGKILAKKIIEYSPYMELVFEGEEIVDVIPTEKPPEPVEIVNEPIDEEKAFLSEAVIQLSNELENLKQEIQILKGGM